MQSSEREETPKMWLILLLTHKRSLNARQYLRPKSEEVITFGDPATSRANTGIEACAKHHQVCIFQLLREHISWLKL